MSYLIRLEHVSKIYQQSGNALKAVDDVSLSVQFGDFISVIGKSGSGKSTLMNIIGLLDDLTEGSYFFEGRCMNGLKEQELAKIRNTHFGYIFQQYNLLSHKTVIENIALPLYYRGIREKERMRIAAEYAGKVNLSHRANHRPNTLSGGECQRVAIARALIGNPRIILADEPTGALDAQNALHIIELLKDLNQREGTTILLVTHDIQLSAQMRSTIRIKDGTITPD